MDEQTDPSEGAEPAELLTPGEVAKLFGVDPKTVTRWATAGKLDAQRTLGGHRRYRADQVHALLEEHRGGQPSDDGRTGAGTAS